jgi:hypothetical protein
MSHAIIYSCIFSARLGYCGMRTKLIALIAVLTLCSGMSAQNFCKRTSVFFEHNASELNEQTKHKLDSLSRLMKDPEYIVELYGHTDSTGSYNYNIQLAHKRMRAIEAYLRPKTKSKLVFTENNLSESEYKIVGKDKERNLAYNRRVDIFLVPTSDGKVQMKGKNHSAAEMPPALFGPCGICNSQPTVKTFMTQEETDRAGIELATTGGDSLITAGMIMVDYNPCTGKYTNPTITFKICPGKPDPKMKLWEADTVNGRILWIESKDTLQFDYTTGCYVFMGQVEKVYNIDKVRDPGPPPTPDTSGRIVPPCVYAYEQFITTDPKEIVKYNAKGDSVNIDMEETKLRVHSVAKTGDDYLLLSMAVDSLPFTYYSTFGYDKVKSFEIPAGNYSKLEYSDTLLKIRCGKTATPGQFGVYLPDYHQYIPFDSTDGKYYYGHKPTVEFQYAYKKGKRLKALKRGTIKSKYKESESVMRIKFNRKQRKTFRSVRLFYEA